MKKLTVSPIPLHKWERFCFTCFLRWGEYQDGGKLQLSRWMWVLSCLRQQQQSRQLRSDGKWNAFSRFNVTQKHQHAYPAHLRHICYHTQQMAQYVCLWVWGVSTVDWTDDSTGFFMLQWGVWTCLLLNMQSDLVSESELRTSLSKDFTFQFLY